MFTMWAMRILKTIGAHLAIIAFFYFNIDALNTTLNLRFEPIVEGTNSLLPNHWIPQRLFRIWDVFDRWSNFNFGYRAYGSKVRLNPPPKTPTAEMIDLKVYDYFPQIRGEANRRLWLQSFRGDPKKMREYHTRIISTIQRLHNEKHPDNEIVQVILYRYEWKKSGEGWDANMDKGSVALEAWN